MNLIKVFGISFIITFLQFFCGNDSSSIKSLEELDVIEIEMVPESPSFGGKGSFWKEGVYCFLTQDIKSNKTKPGDDVLVIKFTDNNKGYIHKPGTYDLGSTINKNHLTCNQSVEVNQDISGDHIQIRNFQAKGTMILDSINYSTGESAGKLIDVYFREIKEIGYYSWGGYTNYDICLHLKYAEWNTFRNVVRPCEKYGPPNCKLQICDPATGYSTLAQCFAGNGSCSNGDSCIIQYPSYGTGACYTSCKPFNSSSCGEGFDCVPTSYDGKSGICKKVGSGKPNQYCKGSYLSTSCEKNHVCGDLEPYWGKNRCYEQVDYFDSNSVCKNNYVKHLRFYSSDDLKAYCYLGRCLRSGICIPRDWIDTAKINQVSKWGEGYPCGLNGNRAEGIVVIENGVPKCRKICRIDLGEKCPPGTTCQKLILHVDQGPNTSVPSYIGVCK